MSEFWRAKSHDELYRALMSMFEQELTLEDVLAEALDLPRSPGGPDDPNGGAFITGEHTVLSLAGEVYQMCRKYRARARLAGEAVAYQGVATYLEMLAGREQDFTPAMLRAEAGGLVRDSAPSAQKLGSVYIHAGPNGEQYAVAQESVRWSPSDLDRCVHGRHKGEECIGCDTISVGNLFPGLAPQTRLAVRSGVEQIRIGTTVYGGPIWGEHVTATEGKHRA